MRLNFGQTKISLASRAVRERDYGRSNLLTPGEAARTELALGAVGAAVGTGIAQVSGQIADARAAEQAADAAIDLSRKLADIDQDLANRPRKVDAQGNIVMDTDELLEEEAKRRQEAYEEVRDGLEDFRTKRMFDERYRGIRVQRQGQYAQFAVRRKAELMSVQAQEKIVNLAAEGDYEGAMLRAEVAVQSGSISQAKFYEMREHVEVTRDNARAYEVFMNPQATQGELLALRDQMAEGEWVDGGEMAISDAQRYTYYARAQQALADFDSAADAEKDRQYEDLYLELMPKTLAGQFSPADLVQYRYRLDKDRFDKLVSMAQANSQRTGNSDPQILEEYRRRAVQLRVGRGFDSELGFQASAEELQDAIALDPRLSSDDVDNLTNDIDRYVSLVRENPEYEQVLDIEVQKITGVQRDQFTVMFEGVDKTHLIIAERLERDFKAAALKAGPKFDAQGWMDANVAKYHLEVQKDILNGYRIQDVPMLGSGQVDFSKLSVMMAEQIQRDAHDASVNEALSAEEYIQSQKEQMETDLRKLQIMVGSG